MSIYYSFSKEINIEIFSCDHEGLISSDSRKDNFSNFIKITTGENFDFPSNYRKMLSGLKVPQSDWPMSVPRFVLKDFLANAASLVEGILENEKNIEYYAYFKKINEFLSSLSLPIIDLDRIKSLISEQEHEGVKNNIASFISESGFAKFTKYDNSSTVTGRLTVKSGPNILIAPASVRSCFKSSFSGGRIAQLDIIAAEPKLAFYLKNKGNAPSDIYDDICKKVFSNKLNRPQVKIATLCALYGQSASNLSKILPPGMSASNIIEEVRRYFDYRSLKKNLFSSFANGEFRNVIGRPIIRAEDSVLVSYFLQSSIAEISIVMFDDFCRSFPEIKPIYLIHDALILDLPPEFVSKYPDNSTVDLFFKDMKFESKINYLSG